MSQGKLEPTVKELASATEIGSLIQLTYTAQRPCRLLSVSLDDSLSWKLHEISINRRYGLLASHYWYCSETTLLPGHRVDVNIENVGWHLGLAPPNVYLGLLYVAPPWPPEVPEEERKFFAEVSQKIDKWGYLPVPAPEPEPPSPPPTRFSELDLADEDE